MHLWSIGEILWDIFPSREVLGGAALNFSANMHRLGHRAELLSAVGDDERGRLALQQMEELGLATRFIQVIDDLPTGVAVVSQGSLEPTFEIARPAAFDGLQLTKDIQAAAAVEQVDWIYIGTLLHTTPSVESLTGKLLSSMPSTRVFYDMNLRSGHWNAALVMRLLGLATVLKLNMVEAQTLFALSHSLTADFGLENFCRDCAARYELAMICVSLGAEGCLLYRDGVFCRASSFPVTVEDTVGSGDAFAAGCLHGFHLDWPLGEIAAFSNALGATVASRTGAAPPWTLEEVENMRSRRS